MPWNNDKIRINYLSGKDIAKEKMVGKFIDTRDYDYKKPKKREELTIYQETEELIFSLSSNFKNELIVEYDPVLDGLKTYTALFTTGETNHKEMNNNYYFNSAPLWNDFWFRNTSRLLLITEP